MTAATSAVASSLYGLVQTHPEDPGRPLVDFDIALTFIPALLLGVSFGGHPPLLLLKRVGGSQILAARHSPALRGFPMSESDTFSKRRACKAVA